MPLAVAQCVTGAGIFCKITGTINFKFKLSFNFKLETNLKAPAVRVTHSGWHCQCKFQVQLMTVRQYGSAKLPVRGLDLLRGHALAT